MEKLSEKRMLLVNNYHKRMKNMLFKRFKECLEKDGLQVTAFFTYNFIKRHLRGEQKEPYEQWILDNEQDIYDTIPLMYNPLFSILVPVYNVKKEQLIECIESVQKQTYKNWELCLVDDASTIPEVHETLKRYEGKEKIKIHYRAENGHISRTTNDGLSMAEGEYIGLLDCDDVLAPNALFEMAKKLNENNKLDFIYSDEDLITEDGKKRFAPQFKSDWCPDTFLSCMYTNHFSIFRKSIAQKIGGYRIGFEGSQDYDFVLRFTEETREIAHIDKILYHWRAREESVASNPETKMYAYEAAMNAKKEALIRRGWNGEVEYLPQVYQSRIIYHYDKEPLVSIIIPSKDHSDYFARCVEGICEKTGYKNIEIIAVDNGSGQKEKQIYQQICNKYNVKYIYEKMEFNFSKMCNIGAENANGDYLLFLNDDIEVIDTKWLSRMVGHAMLPHIGAVGAKLYYPNQKTIQHIGVINRIIGPEHFWGKKPEDETGYRMLFEHNYAAVTGACLLVERKKYDLVQGWNEQFPVAYNDIDLCFKLVEQGFYNVVRCDSALVHHESISRGMDKIDAGKAERLKEDKERLYKLHPSFNQYDFFFSNHDLEIYNLPKLSVNETSIKLSELEKYSCSSTVQYYLDTVCDQRRKKIRVYGQFCLKGKSQNAWNQVEIYLIGKSRNYCIKTKKWYLPLEQNASSHKGDALSGFFGIIDGSELQSGEYKVILLGKYGMQRKKYSIDCGKVKI